MPKTAITSAATPVPVSAFKRVTSRAPPPAMRSPANSSRPAPTRPISRPTRGLRSTVNPLSATSRTPMSQAEARCTSPKYSLSANTSPT